MSRGRPTIPASLLALIAASIIGTGCSKAPQESKTKPVSVIPTGPLLKPQWTCVVNDHPIRGQVYTTDENGFAAIYLYNSNNDTASIAWISPSGKKLATVYANFRSVIAVSDTNLYASIAPLHDGNQPIVTKYTLSGTNVSQEFLPSGDYLLTEEELAETNRYGGPNCGAIIVSGTNALGYELSYFPFK